MKKCRCLRPQKSDDLEVAEPIGEELLNEEFECYMRVAKSLQRMLKRPKDVEICKILLEKCHALNDCFGLEVKKYATQFLKYFLRVLNWTSANQPLDLYDNWYNSRRDNANDKSDTKIWLEQEKSYIAMKEMSDGSIVFYCAIASKKTAGWEYAALKHLKDKLQKAK